MLVTTSPLQIYTMPFSFCSLLGFLSFEGNHYVLFHFVFIHLVLAVPRLCCSAASPLIAASRGFSSVVVCGPLSCCRAQAVGARASVAAAYRLSCPAAREILLVRDRTHVLCTGRQIHAHCTTRRVLCGASMMELSVSVTAPLSLSPGQV